MPNRDLTTGEICRLLRVSITLVIEWINSGELEAYKVPGSQHRRITRENFFDFLRRHSIPVEIVCPRRVPIAVYDPRGREYARHLGRELILTTTEVRSYNDLFSLGAGLRTFSPGLALLDLRKGHAKMIGELCCHVSRMRDSLQQSYPLVVVDIVDTKAQKDQLLALPALQRPADVLVGKVEVTAIVKSVLAAFMRCHGTRIPPAAKPVQQLESV